MVASQTHNVEMHGCLLMRFTHDLTDKASSENAESSMHLTQYVSRRHRGVPSLIAVGTRCA